MPRLELAAAIWPDVEIEVAANRLRTALVHARQGLAPWQPLRAEGGTLCFSSVEASIDVHAAEGLYRCGRIAESLEEEKRSLERLLDMIGVDFLEGERWTWADELRGHWRERRIEVALRLARIGISQDELELAESESLRALETDGHHEEAWTTYLHTLAAAGKSPAAAKRFESARRRHLAEFGFDFSPDLLNLARRVSLGQVPARRRTPTTSAPARELMARTMERQLATDPNSLLPLFASDSFRKEALGSPTQAWELVQQAVDSTSGISEERVAVMMLALSLADMVDAYRKGLEYAEWLVDNLPEGRREHRYAINILGFISFDVREWDDAWRYLRRFEQLAEAHGDPLDIATARSQIATLHWHRGELELALGQYRDQLALFDHDPTTRGLHNSATLRANIGILLTVMGDWVGARESLSQAYSMALANEFDHVRGLVMAPHGLSLIMAGRESEGRRLVSLGMSHTFRSHYRRAHQVAADYAAGALARTGFEPLALAVLNVYASFRERTSHARSVSECRFASWVEAQCGDAVPDGSVSAQARVAAVVARACDALDRP
ncbi:MAG: bacterial transcriptional activator domain-containing protein [Fimbriimonadaceae bacterium]|nr:bacterial transcriptional activator domain-containing protein [Fimbriimonadaceae bacterium]